MDGRLRRGRKTQRQVMKARSYESIQYDEDEEDNWSDETVRDSYQEAPRSAAKPAKKTYADQYDDYDDDLETDAWDDSPKPVNIPKKVKERQVEYEEEGY